MATFVLVHGAWHGGWCWDRLVPELEARGHRAVTMDLPIDEPTATFADYTSAVEAAMDAAGAGEDSVVVGHSLGGMVIPLIAARRPVGALVFLCAAIPNLTGMPWEDAPPMGRDDYGAVREPDGALVFDSLEAAREIFYADCSAEEATWAFARLRPFRNGSLWDRPYPLDAWPDVPMAAVACADDLAMYADYQVAACRARLGIDPVVIPGQHSPFLARPAQLADTLITLQPSATQDPPP